MKNDSKEAMQYRIKELEERLEESEQLINAIKSGEVDAFAINNNDQSEIYTLQSGDYAYRVLIEEFEEGALNVNEEGLIVYTNPYFCKLINKSYDRVIGSKLTDFIHGDSLETFFELFQKSLTAGCKGEINLIGKNGPIPVYVSLTSLQPKLPTVGIIITDYTDKKKTENVILKYQAHLESNNHELKVNNEELASFVYVASHDLQEPLRKIQMFASRITDHEFETLSQSVQQYVGKMQLAAERMQTLIKDLLTYAHTNKPDYTFSNHSLREVVEEVKSELKEEIISSGAHIACLEMCDADIIQFQFKQLLINLISNSIKFSQPDKAPHIQIQSRKVLAHEIEETSKVSLSGDYCHFRISDNGIGFEQQYSEQIFEVFKRLHNQSEYPGTGIGLAIVKKIVNNHDGIISASSSPNIGTTYDISFPYRTHK
ncbi:PAS domain-containing sensor histidine kinase [Sediminicola sp. 1XM1-17]|uniref:PAS domain-containing sensor histidine kinase n=1 Tax=Sediminicola sp. 1XM1-17 TaxID=3127702 RepID=UPI0030780DBE